MSELIYNPHIINKWKVDQSRPYTADDVLDAYLKGKEEGVNFEKRVMLEKLQQNLNIATTEGVNIFNILNNEKITCKHCFLKIENPISFEIVYIINSNDYTEENLNKVYTKSKKKKKEINKDTFYLNFSFIPDNGNLNEKRLVADGYFLKYNQES